VARAKVRLALLNLAEARARERDRSWMVVDSLKVLDPEKRPIREAGIFRARRHVSKVPNSDIQVPVYDRFDFVLYTQVETRNA
jgi:hypothetical protein